MVGEIKEISREAQVDFLSNFEMLVKGEVIVPGAGANDVVPRGGIVEPTEGGVVTRVIGQIHGELPNILPRAVGTGQSRHLVDESPLDLCGICSVEIAGKPLPVVVTAE